METTAASVGRVFLAVRPDQHQPCGQVVVGPVHQLCGVQCLLAVRRQCEAGCADCRGSVARALRHATNSLSPEAVSPEEPRGPAEVEVRVKVRRWGSRRPSRVSTAGPRRSGPPRPCGCRSARTGCRRRSAGRRRRRCSRRPRGLDNGRPPAAVRQGSARSRQTSAFSAEAGLVGLLSGWNGRGTMTLLYGEEGVPADRSTGLRSLVPPPDDPKRAQFPTLSRPRPGHRTPVEVAPAVDVKLSRALRERAPAHASGVLGGSPEGGVEGRAAGDAGAR